MKKLFGIICVCILSYWMIQPLFVNGYFPMHDDTQVARVVVMGRALTQGQFPVRWVSDLGYGYGYPIYNFYGPLPYYLGGSLYAVGIDSVVATKTMFAVGAILAGISLFLFMESIAGGAAGVVAAVLFMYAPYHAVQLYIRGSVGEYWAIAFVPFILLGIRYIFSKKSTISGICVGSIGIFGTVCSHTIIGYVSIGMLCAGFTVYTLGAIIQKKKMPPNLLPLLLLVITGLGLSAFFWLPAFWEMGSTGVSRMVNGAVTNFYDHFVCVGQLWNSPWGYGGSAPGCTDGMSLKLGKFQLLISLLGIGIWIQSIRRQKITPAIQFMGIGIALFIVSVIGMVQLTERIWRMIPFASYIQYPWRLLSFSILALGICGGFILTAIQKTGYRYCIGIMLILFSIGINARLFNPQYLYPRDSKAFETKEELRYTISKISDEYLPPDIARPVSSGQVVQAEVQADTPIKIISIENTNTYMKLVLESPLMQKIRINTAYFPGWVYRVNGSIIAPMIVGGLPAVVVLEGQSTIEARFTNTAVRTVGNIISIVFLIFLGGIIIYDKKTHA